MVKANNRQVIDHIVKQMKALLDENPSPQVEDVVLPQVAPLRCPPSCSRRTSPRSMEGPLIGNAPPE